MSDSEVPGDTDSLRHQLTATTDRLLRAVDRLELCLKKGPLTAGITTVYLALSPSLHV